MPWIAYGVYSLVGSVQNYDWEISGSSGSKVARLYGKNTGLAVEEEKRYAEFWMGTHPFRPFYVLREEGNVKLKEFIEKYSSVFGQKVIETWGNDLPFLFKEWFSEASGILIVIGETECRPT